MSEKEPDPIGLKAAKRYAGWHIGDAQWAESIIYAYLNPERANEDMDAEDVPKRTGVTRSSW